MQQLETRKQMHKLDLYHNFTRVLVVSLLICVAFASYQMCVFL
jgi:hypothetical protein